MAESDSFKSDSPPNPPPKKVDSPRIVKQLRDEMAGHWHVDDQFLKKFFPVDPTRDSSYRRTRKEHYNTKKKRWKRILPTPTLSGLHKSLTNLMNTILLHYGITKDERVFHNIHASRRQKKDSDDLDVEPGILLAGIGSEFASTRAAQPRATYRSGISALQVSLDSDDLTEARDRLAVHMYRIFQEQFNRRFAFGLVITQNAFTVYMFDHSGAVASEPCDYHAHPDQFCAVVSGLASRKEQIGFDTSMSSNRHHIKICTQEPVKDDLVAKVEYIVERPLFQSPSLVGRGTMCCLTTGPDDTTYVVKDAWIAQSELDGRESEGSLLRHAQAQGVLLGVAQIRHSEEIRLSDGPSDLDTVVRNRKLDGPSLEGKSVERVHTRIVMASYGKMFDEFDTRQELLLAFYDVVVAHRTLHDVAGILHRDISVRNILINPDGVEGDRGILIDFDHAIRIGDTSPYSTKTKIGTWRYMSRGVLRESGSHTYLDDLESFYYVLCWILVTYEGPKIQTEKVDELVACWDEPPSFKYKHGCFIESFDLPVVPWFGASLRSLAERLHHFFHLRRGLMGKPLSSLDPVTDYDEFLAHIQQAVADLEKEFMLDPEKEPKPVEEARKRKRSADSDEAPVIPSTPLRSAPRRPISPPSPVQTRHGAARHRALFDD